jgi:hypothetical protein
MRAETVPKSTGGRGRPSNNAPQEPSHGNEIRSGGVVSSRPAISLTNIVIQKLSENSRTAVPTTTDYITATGKEVLIVLESAAKVIPVPFLQDAIGVALKIIQVCEVRWIPSLKVVPLMKTFHQDASAVEQKVKDLQERVSHLMIDILRHVTPKSEEGNNEAVVKVMKGIEEDIKQLLWCVATNCGPRSLLMIL